MIENIYISCAVRRERERNGRRGLIGKLIAAKSLGSATTHILMLNHQCPRLRRRTREPAANLLSICLLSCSSRDLQKLRLLFLLICIRLQNYKKFCIFRHFLQIILWTHCFFLYLRIRLLHNIIRFNYSRFFSALPAPVPLYFDGVTLKR